MVPGERAVCLSKKKRGRGGGRGGEVKNGGKRSQKCAEGEKKGRAMQGNEREGRGGGGGGGAGGRGRGPSRRTNGTWGGGGEVALPWLGGAGAKRQPRATKKGREFSVLAVVRRECGEWARERGNCERDEPASIDPQSSLPSCRSTNPPPQTPFLPPHPRFVLNLPSLKHYPIWLYLILLPSMEGILEALILSRTRRRHTRRPRPR
jgi:hypothetical protein